MAREEKKVDLTQSQYFGPALQLAEQLEQNDLMMGAPSGPVARVFDKLGYGIEVVAEKARGVQRAFIHTTGPQKIIVSARTNFKPLQPGRWGETRYQAQGRPGQLDSPVLAFVKSREGTSQQVEIDVMERHRHALPDHFKPSPTVVPHLGGEAGELRFKQVMVGAEMTKVPGLLEYGLERGLIEPVYDASSQRWIGVPSSALDGLIEENMFKAVDDAVKDPRGFFDAEADKLDVSREERGRLEERKERLEYELARVAAQDGAESLEEYRAGLEQVRARILLSRTKKEGRPTQGPLRRVDSVLNMYGELRDTETQIAIYQEQESYRSAEHLRGVGEELEGYKRQLEAHDAVLTSEIIGRSEQGLALGLAQRVISPQSLMQYDPRTSRAIVDGEWPPIGQDYMQAQRHADISRIKAAGLRDQALIVGQGVMPLVNATLDKVGDVIGGKGVVDEETIGRIVRATAEEVVGRVGLGKQGNGEQGVQNIDSVFETNHEPHFPPDEESGGVEEGQEPTNGDLNGESNGGGNNEN